MCSHFTYGDEHHKDKWIVGNFGFSTSEESSALLAVQPVDHLCADVSHRCEYTAAYTLLLD